MACGILSRQTEVSGTETVHPPTLAKTQTPDNCKL